MKCLVCTQEIDELKEFPPTIGPGGVQIEDTLGKWKHSQAVGAWIHLTLTAQVSAGTVTVLAGHVCPLHPTASITLTSKQTPLGDSTQGSQSQGKSTESSPKRSQ